MAASSAQVNQLAELAKLPRDGAGERVVDQQPVVGRFSVRANAQNASAKKLESGERHAARMSHERRACGGQLGVSPCK